MWPNFGQLYKKINPCFARNICVLPEACLKFAIVELVLSKTREKIMLIGYRSIFTMSNSNFQDKCIPMNVTFTFYVVVLFDEPKTRTSPIVRVEPKMAGLLTGALTNLSQAGPFPEMKINEISFLLPIHFHSKLEN